MKRGVLLGLIVFMLSGCDLVEQPGEETILRVATDASSAPIAAEMFNEYEAATPGVYFSTGQGNLDMALIALQAGEIDFALLFLPGNIEASFQAVIGVEAVILVVHPDNPVEVLTTTQARAIFNGLIVNWVTVGGIDSSIHVVTREDGSDTRRAFQTLALGDRSYASTAQVATSGARVLDIVANDPQAMGYVTLEDLDDCVRALSLNGVAPSSQTIRTGEYALTGQIMFVARGEPEGAAGEFLSWLLARE